MRDPDTLAHVWAKPVHRCAAPAAPLRPWTGPGTSIR